MSELFSFAISLNFLIRDAIFLYFLYGIIEFLNLKKKNLNKIIILCLANYFDYVARIILIFIHFIFRKI